MKFHNTRIPGVFLIEQTPLADARGFFARSWCQREFQRQGLHDHFVQCNLSFNKLRGTLRGMHFQKAPHEEVKIVQCMQGRIFDVVVDIRPESPSFGLWEAFELSNQNHRALYIPGGCAHGFVTLEDASIVHYHMGEFYYPEDQGGLLWNDPKVGIQWPIAEPLYISDRDRLHPGLEQFS